MTPKEKAKDLINSFYYSLPNNGSETGLNSTTERYKEAIQCALICVDELMNALKGYDFYYWQEIKSDLQSL